MSDDRTFNVMRDGFHKHLDGCEQCRNHPHELCTVGAVLIRAMASSGAARFSVDESGVVRDAVGPKFGAVLSDGEPWVHRPEKGKGRA